MPSELYNNDLGHLQASLYACITRLFRIALVLNGNVREQSSYIESAIFQIDCTVARLAQEIGWYDARALMEVDLRYVYRNTVQKIPALDKVMAAKVRSFGEVAHV